MASIGLPSLQLVFALVLLTPGFITVKAARHRGKITKPLEEFDKAIYTLVASGASIAVVVVLYSLTNWQWPTTTVTAEYQLWELSLGFLAAILIAGSTGWGIGWWIDEKMYEGEDTRKDTVWTLIFDHSAEPREVRVVTTDGTEIHGYIYVSDSEPHGQDVLLQYPQLIIRENGEIKNRVSIGEYVFFSQEDISHMYFESEISI